MNNVFKSESVSSYFSCITNEDERTFPDEHTKTITATKSRLYIRYEHDVTENARNKNYNNRTLYALQPRRSLAKHNPQPVIYVKQTSHLHSHGVDEERDIDRFRRSSNREIGAAAMKKVSRTEKKSAALWKSSDNKVDEVLSATLTLS